MNNFFLKIIVNIFFMLGLFGLMIANPDKGWLKFICIFLFIVQGIRLYINFNKMTDIINEKKYQERRKSQKRYNDNYRKTMDEYQRLLDEIYRKINNNNRRNQYQPPPSNNQLTDVQKAYKLMDLKLTDDITTIKRKYRELAMKYHPDKFVQDTRKSQEVANRNFQKLNNAYTIIKNHKNFA